MGNRPAASIFASSDVLEARMSRRRLWLGLALAPLVIAACAYSSHTLWRGLQAGTVDVFKTWVWLVTFALFILLFVGVAISFVSQLRDPGPVLRIDRTSIHDRRLTRDAITWGEIEALTHATINGQQYLQLHVRDAALRTAGGSKLWSLNRAAARMNGRPELAVNLSMLDLAPEQVLARVSTIVPERLTESTREWRLPV